MEKAGQKETAACPCRRVKCVRHGDCAACSEHHRAKGKMLTTCERLHAKKEKTHPAKI